MNASHPIGDSTAPCPHAPHSGINSSVSPYAVGIDVKIAAEWSGFYTGLPLAIAGALNLTHKLAPEI